MKKLLFCIAAILCCNAFSQGYNNWWVFGDSALLDFTTGTPQYGNSSIITNETCASISDTEGNLLFYTNGEKVWNSAHSLMPSGDGLDLGGLFPPFGTSITQGALIIPKPGSTNLYYVIQMQNYGGIYDIGLKYSIVDMTLNGGLGDVTEKNIPFFDIYTEEKMQAVKHGNGRDWWLIVRRYDTITADIKNIDFVKFLITPAGISPAEFQHYDPEYNEFLDTGWGQMIFSQDGSRMLFPRQLDLNLFDFDRCTGEFSNLVEIKNIEATSYGCSFSPDGTKIYVSGVCEKKIFQYCLTCDGEPIDSTKELVYEGPTGQFCLAQHQLGPDGKIYIATVYNIIPNDVFNSKNQNLCVINNPNEIYPLCDFDTNTVSLGTRRVIGALPNMPNYNLGALVGSECDTLGTSVKNLLAKTKINIYPNPANDELYLNCESDIELNYSLKTILGSEIRSGNFIGKETIDMLEIASGVYIIEISDNLGKIKYSEKIVKE